MHGKNQRNLLPGGFDHFDWAIYDEVHSIDGAEGAALQRIIRSMNCKFLALSATVGNADELRDWMERVKGEQLFGVEAVDYDRFAKKEYPATEDNRIKVMQTHNGEVLDIEVDNTDEFTVLDLKMKLFERIPDIVDPSPVDHGRYPIQLMFNDIDLSDDTQTLKSYGVFNSTDKLIVMRSLVNLLTHQSRFINLQRYVWDNQNSQLQTVSPLAVVDSVDSLKNGILDNSSLSFTSKDRLGLLLLN